MKFHVLCQYFERLDATTKRLEMFDILAELFSEAPADEIDKIIYLSQGQLAPPFEDVEIGISTKLLIRSISEAADRPTKDIEALYAKEGDLGTVAEQTLAGKERLDVMQVFSELMRIAGTSGKGSVQQKTGLLSGLMKAVSSVEAKYIARFVIGRLRLGIGDPTVLEALALSEGDRALRPELERAYNLCSDLGLVAGTLKRHGLEGLKAFKVHVGNPIRMALCERLPSSEDIIEKMGRAAIEAKYDGFRCQVHKDGDEVKIFSRNLELMTHMFPEIVEATRALTPRSLILEGEALAHNEVTGELLPFQVTIQRKRKHGVEDMAKELPLRFFAFELLYLDGTDYTQKPYSERRHALEKLIQKSDALEPATMFETSDPADIRAHFDEFVETGLEGVVAKRLDAPYTAGSRNFNWIKLKRSYKGELADTLDVCVVGYYRGRGQRARFGIGALLAAVYDSDSDTFKTVTKIGTGFTDEEFFELKNTLDGIKLKHRHARVDSVMEADVWVEPRYVITVTADEITRSPSHTAGRDETDTGYALRFPRAEGFLRTDKDAEDATSVEELVKMAGQQKQVKVK